MFGDSIIGKYTSVIHIFFQKNAEFMRRSKKDEDKNIVEIRQVRDHPKICVNLHEGVE